MKPAPFAYHAPESLEEALSLLAEHGWDAKPLAGGQSLIPAMNFRLAQPAVLVDLNRIDALSFVEPTSSGGLRIGAMTRQRAVERHPLVAERSPLLHETMPWIAHPQIRNRGTFGGSLAHADPAAELPAVATALDAVLVALGPEGERRIPAAEFFLGLLTTALEPGELLVEVELPAMPERSGVAFLEFARRHGDYALVGVAARVTLAPDGTVADSRLVLLSVGDGPVMAEGARAALQGHQPDAEAIAAASAAARDGVEPSADIHASAAYRTHLVEVLTRRALKRAAERAAGTLT